MKKLLLVLVLQLLVWASGEGLVTGQSMKFVPGDKVLFSEDFSQCPIGEIPTSFDDIEGAVECVKYKNRMWLSKNSGADTRLYKFVNLGNNEFEIDFTSIAMGKSYQGRLMFKFYDTNKTKGVDDFFHLEQGGCEFKMTRAGHFYTMKGCKKKPLHIALQVRRHQLRIYINNKRVMNTLWKYKQNIKMIEIYSDGDPYNYLISDIRVAKYSTKEEAPKPQKVGVSIQKIQGGEKLTVPEKVLFDFNKYMLKPEAKKALEVVGAYIKQTNPKKIVVIGYTDNVGSDEYNLALSFKRAQSVADYLIYCARIDPKKIEIKGLGKANPIAPNNTEANRAKNRRVEIKLMR